MHSVEIVFESYRTAKMVGMGPFFSGYEATYSNH